MVLAKSAAAFELRYEMTAQFASYEGQLRNSGELLTMLDRFGEQIFSLSYSDSGSWPGRADGIGSSLERIDFAMPENESSNWRASAEYDGSPGAAGIAPFQDVVVNEVISHTDLPDVDAIELYNTTTEPIEIGGWYVSDTSDEFRKFRIPDDTMLLGESYVTFDETDFNASMGQAEGDFALSSLGDDVWLLEADADDDLLRFADRVEFEAAANGVTWGRWPNGTGELFPMQSQTLDEHNSGPFVSSVIVSEIMYHPSANGIGEEFLEYFELHNSSVDEVEISGWRIVGGVDFEFAADTFLAGGASLVIVGFDPNDNALVDQFRNVFSAEQTVVPDGPFNGRLDNNGERIALYRTDDPPIENPAITPLILLDEVRYGTTVDWPSLADGGGPSLARSDPNSFGRDAISWYADTPTPGRFVDGAPRVTQWSVNESFVDPLDLPRGPQPTSWLQQRSDLREITIHFTEAVSLDESDLILTNLGVNAPADTDNIVGLLPQHIALAQNVLTLSFSNYELADGVYSLELTDTVADLTGVPIDGDGDLTGGDGWTVTGAANNRLSKLRSDFNGDDGVSVFDFSTFSYWFGMAVPTAPAYSDMNDDGGISVFDFTHFSNNFGIGVIYPVAFALRVEQPVANERLPMQRLHMVDAVEQRVELLESDSDWNAVLWELAKRTRQNLWDV